VDLAFHRFESISMTLKPGTAMMSLCLLASSIVLWLVVLVLSFLLLGALRGLALMRWRLEELEATMPSRVGRSGLKPGKKAPDFNLPTVSGGEIALREFAGRQIFLVFTQSGCGPCHQIMPELNRLQFTGTIQVLVVNNGEIEVTRKWAAEARAQLLVAVQEHYSLSRQYEVFATPFAFLIDERGIIVSKGIVNNRQHIELVLSGCAGNEANHHHVFELDALAAVSS
jgi:methylamine dehydrogenase accessory protein MauD